MTYIENNNNFNGNYKIYRNTYTINAEVYGIGTGYYITITVINGVCTIKYYF